MFWSLGPSLDTLWLKLSRSCHRQNPSFLYLEVISWVRVCFNGFKSVALQKAVVRGHSGQAFCHRAQWRQGSRQRRLRVSSGQLESWKLLARPVSHRGREVRARGSAICSSDPSNARWILPHQISHHSPGPTQLQGLFTLVLLYL